MSAEVKASVAAGAIAVPAAVTQGTVHLTDERRYQVPVTMICPEFTPAQAQEWIDGGDIPELAKASSVDFLDLDSGHWPMFTQPVALAALIDEAARS
jgi:pimeloyl-ACP methyl ester carboxylesterase